MTAPHIDEDLLHIRVLRDNLLDAESEVDTDRRDIDAACARLREHVARRDDLQRQLAQAVAIAERL
jgi:hypothetical protein